MKVSVTIPFVIDRGFSPVTARRSLTGYALANLLKDSGLTESTSESLRMVKQGAVKIDGEKVTDAKLLIYAGSRHVYQVGKRRFARIKL